jgi:hypothetical protein
MPIGLPQKLPEIAASMSSGRNSPACASLRAATYASIIHSAPRAKHPCERDTSYSPAEQWFKGQRSCPHALLHLNPNYGLGVSDI